LWPSPRRLPRRLQDIGNKWSKENRMDLVSQLSSQFQKGLELMMNPQGDQNADPASDAFNFFGRREPLPDAPQMSGQVGQVLAGVYQGAVKPPMDFMASPAGIATAPLAGARAMQIAGKLAAPYFAYEGGKEILDIDPSKQSTQEVATKASAGVANLAGALGAAYAGRPRFLPGHGDEAMIALHAGPYDFERFDFSKIGSGEGVQAFGHGLYFAEGKGVNKNYYEKFRAVPDEFPLEEYFKVGGERFDWTNPEHIASVNLELSGGDKDAAIKKINYSSKIYPSGSPGGMAHKQAIDIINYSQYPVPKATTSADLGMNYKVDLPFEKEDLLHWDLPLSKQPKKVQEILKKEGLEATDMSNPTGAPIYNWYSKKLSKNIPEGVAEWDLDNRIPDPEAASKYLASIGIPGIAYLDQSSRPPFGRFGVPDPRDTRKKTHNIVAFSDKDIKILEKKRGLFDDSEE